MRLALQLQLMHALLPFRLSASICLDDPAPWLHPRCDTRKLPSYYGRVRQRARRRYSAPCGFCRLEIFLSPPVKLAAVSERAFTSSTREPGPSSCCLYAGHHLGSKRVTPKFIPGLKPDPGFDVV